ncbi:MAG: c-type cytochrome [Verrucomicrobiales bacterium]|nr:c-type cytochrome [Verrucomicrobiales bacterium]
MKTIRLCALFVSLSSPLFGQDALELSADEFPRVPATKPAEVLKTFEVEEGFQLDLVAHEPDVMDPIAMAFDEKGRAYVLEMRGYSERRESALGRVRLLTDTNGDGKFDHSTVFKDGLKWPTAILCYKGGVFVGATPDVHYFKDTDGDGVADEAKHLFTGFGEGPPRLNMQALFNSFRWGPDNRVWGATAGNGGIVTRVGDDSFEPVPLRGADFSFDPEKLDLRPENGTAQYGMSFDSEGRRFICTNSRHIIWVAYERHQVNPNPWYRLPSPLVDIPDDGAAAPVYRTSPDEPWRIVRTRWRVSGVVKGVVEGGGRVSGYFTSATGVHLYWGDAFGEDYRNNTFIGDVGSNLIHRKLITFPNGQTEPVATRANPDLKSEFIRSRDNWFRPTSFATGPDGCLYITDMYRETIEHPWSLPEPIKKHVDLNSGFDRGRIYRAAPIGTKVSRAPDLSLLSDKELQELLTHTNDWHQTTARRLLYERGTPAAPKPAVEPFPAILSSTHFLKDYTAAADGDEWIRAGFLNSIRTKEDLTAALQAVSAIRPGALHIALAELVGSSGDMDFVRMLMNSTGTAPVNDRLVSELSALKQGLQAHKSGWKDLLKESAFKNLLNRAVAILSKPDSSESKKSDALSILSLSGSSSFDSDLKSLFESAQSAALRNQLATTIRDLDFLVDHFTDLSDESRNGITAKLLANESTSLAFLESLKTEKVTVAETPAQLIAGLRAHQSKKVRELAATTLPPVISREQVIADYSGALAGKGDRAKGQLAFEKACMVCHRSHEGKGIVLGPAITTFSNAGAESLLGNILNPNKEVAPQYQAFTFELKSGEVLIGIIESESAEEVTMKMVGGVSRTFPRNQVESMKGLGQSLMPEGLEASLTVEEMRDLLSYLAAPAK